MSNMAFVVFTNNQSTTLTHNQALALDKVKRGLINGSTRQKAYARRVKKIYFSKQHKQSDREDIPVPAWWHK